MIKLPHLLKRRNASRLPEAGESGVPISFPDEGSLVVRDPRLFRPGSEKFCQDLAEAAVGRTGVRSVYICLASATCRIEFEPSRFQHAEMAERFAESVRVAISQKKPPGPQAWISMMRFADGEGGGAWETTRERNGSLRLRNQSRVRDRGEARRVANELSAVPGIKSSRVTLLGPDLEIGFDPGRVSSIEVFSAADQALHPLPSRSEGPSEKTPAVATGLRRLGYLALAGGSFGLTLLALVIPGIPTVPFLLATSYYLVRSSPTLNRKLHQSKFFGPILVDLESSHGLRRINKFKLIGFTIAVGLVTLVLSGPSLPILAVMVTVTSISIYAITRIPGIPIGSALAPVPLN